MTWLVLLLTLSAPSPQKCRVNRVVGVQVAYAVVTNPGQAACLAANPMAPSVKATGQIAFYARVTTNCGATITPTPPPSWPARCP